MEPPGDKIDSSSTGISGFKIITATIQLQLPPSSKHLKVLNCFSSALTAANILLKLLKGSSEVQHLMELDIGDKMKPL